MSTYMSRDLQDGVLAAQRAVLKKASRLRVVAGGSQFKILRFNEDSFVLDAEDAPRLRGLVDIFDGSVHLYQALIVASEQQGDEVAFEFKRNTMAAKEAARDFVMDPKAPIALLAKETS